MTKPRSWDFSIRSVLSRSSTPLTRTLRRYFGHQTRCTFKLNIAPAFLAYRSISVNIHLAGVFCQERTMRFLCRLKSAVPSHKIYGSTREYAGASVGRLRSIRSRGLRGSSCGVRIFYSRCTIGYARIWEVKPNAILNKVKMPELQGTNPRI